MPSAMRPVPIWLIPLAYLLIGVVAGFAFPRVEYVVLPGYSHAMSVATAQAYLSAIASGMMTLTAIVFSIVFLMLQFTTSAYSKRLVMLFAGHPISAHALGVFFATFIYALGVLLFVDRNQGGKVPVLSTQFATVLVVLSMVVLTLLIERIGLLRITYILQYVGDQGRAAIVQTLPRLDEHATDEIEKLQQMSDQLRTQLCRQKLVYDGTPLAVTSYRIDACVRQAGEWGGTIVMNCAVGDTVSQGTVLLEVYGTTGPIPPEALLSGIVLGMERTFKQDPKYSIRLLVDTAIMALSPAVNDPTTAVQAIDQIEDLLHRLGCRVLDTGFVKDAEGQLRLVFPMPTWEEYLSLAFDEIRIYGKDTMQVLRRMRAALLDLEQSLASPERRASVRRYLDHLERGVAQSGFDASDRAIALQADPQGLGHTRAPLL
jgi:uncharacterized membrane protein